MALADELVAERERLREKREAAKYGPVLGSRVDKEVKDRIDRIAKRLRVYQSDVVRACLRRGVAELEREIKEGKKEKPANPSKAGKAV